MRLSLKLVPTTKVTSIPNILPYNTVIILIILIVSVFLIEIYSKITSITILPYRSISLLSLLIYSFNPSLYYNYVQNEGVTFDELNGFVD